MMLRRYHKEVVKEEPKKEGVKNDNNPKPSEKRTSKRKPKG
jgi:hypothetical protein